MDEKEIQRQMEKAMRDAGLGDMNVNKMMSLSDADIDQLKKLENMDISQFPGMKELGIRNADDLEKLNAEKMSEEDRRKLMTAFQSMSGNVANIMSSVLGGSPAGLQGMASGGMRYCTSCGKPAGRDVKFCPECGTKF